MSKRQRLIYLVGVLLCALSALSVLADINLPRWLMMLMFIIVFPIAVYFVHLSSKQFFEGTKTDTKYIFKNGKFKATRPTTNQKDDNETDS